MEKAMNKEQRALFFLRLSELAKEITANENTPTIYSPAHALPNFRETQGKKASERRAKSTDLTKGRYPMSRVGVKEPELSAQDLVDRFHVLQQRADLTGIPQDVWDSYGYIATCFPRKVEVEP
jgi:hypothetical protein